MENLIEIQDVVKRFGEQTVLDHVSLSVTPGKIYGIIGRNGSGKTVLFPFPFPLRDLKMPTISDVEKARHS